MFMGARVPLPLFRLFVANISTSLPDVQIASLGTFIMKLLCILLHLSLICTLMMHIPIVMYNDSKWTLIYCNVKLFGQVGNLASLPSQQHAHILTSTRQINWNFSVVMYFHICSICVEFVFRIGDTSPDGSTRNSFIYAFQNSYVWAVT